MFEPFIKAHVCPPAGHCCTASWRSRPKQGEASSRPSSRTCKANAYTCPCYIADSPDFVTLSTQHSVYSTCHPTSPPKGLLLDAAGDQAAMSSNQVKSLATPPHNVRHLAHCSRTNTWSCEFAPAPAASLRASSWPANEEDCPRGSRPAPRQRDHNSRAIVPYSKCSRGKPRQVTANPRMCAEGTLAAPFPSPRCLQK